jgi:hypothetical protein
MKAELLFERNTCCKLAAVRINRNTYYKLQVRTLSGATMAVNPKLHLPRGVLQFFADTGRGGSASKEGMQTQMFEGRSVKQYD